MSHPSTAQITSCVLLQHFRPFFQGLLTELCSQFNFYVQSQHNEQGMNLCPHARIMSSLVKDLKYCCVPHIWTYISHIFTPIANYTYDIYCCMLEIMLMSKSNIHLETYCWLNTVSCVLNLSRNPLSSWILLRITHEFPFSCSAFLKHSDQLCSAKLLLHLKKHFQKKSYTNTTGKSINFISLEGCCSLAA